MHIREITITTISEESISSGGGGPLVLYKVGVETSNFPLVLCIHLIWHLCIVSHNICVF